MKNKGFDKWIPGCSKWGHYQKVNRTNLQWKEILSMSNPNGVIVTFCHLSEPKLQRHIAVLLRKFIPDGKRIDMLPRLKAMVTIIADQVSMLLETLPSSLSTSGDSPLSNWVFSFLMASTINIFHQWTRKSQGTSKSPGALWGEDSGVVTKHCP